jgi:GT2 family glycosyltransferase
MTDHLTVTVVVSTRNRGAMIEPALRSLMALDYPAFDVVVLDQSTNGTTRDCVLEVAASDQRIRYVPSTLVGLSSGRNAGLAASSADIIAFTDDDCVADPGWLTAVEQELRDPDVAGVFGRVLPNVEGRKSGIDLAFKDSEVRVEYSGKSIPWYIGHGANMAFRRADLVAIGAFDEVLGAGGKLPSHEDADISYRLLAAGRRLVFAPRSLVYHRQWRDWDERKRTEYAYGIGAGGQFAKYIRSGDMYGLRLLGTWVWQLGVRRVGAGLIKWRSGKVVYLGLTQLTVPWIGVWRSLRFGVDPALLRYR